MYGSLDNKAIVANNKLCCDEGQGTGQPLVVKIQSHIDFGSTLIGYFSIRTF
jgi:hypothetical protein